MLVALTAHLTTREERLVTRALRPAHSIRWRSEASGPVLRARQSRVGCDDAQRDRCRRLGAQHEWT